MEKTSSSDDESSSSGGAPGGGPARRRIMVTVTTLVCSNKGCVSKIATYGGGKSQVNRLLRIVGCRCAVRNHNMVVRGVTMAGCCGSHYLPESRTNKFSQKWGKSVRFGLFFGKTCSTGTHQSRARHLYSTTMPLAASVYYTVPSNYHNRVPCGTMVP